MLSSSESFPTLPLGVGLMPERGVTATGKLVQLTLRAESEDRVLDSRLRVARLQDQAVPEP